MAANKPSSSWIELFQRPPTKPRNTADTEEGYPRGIVHHSAKLTEADVNEIRARYSDGGITQQELSEQFGITISGICNIINGKTWKHLL